MYCALLGPRALISYTCIEFQFQQSNENAADLVVGGRYARSKSCGGF